MAGNFLKTAGLICGGALTVGLGAVGTHLSQPFLESKFNPERKNNETKLKQSLEDKNKQVESLGQDLEKIRRKHDIDNETISDLTYKSSKLQEQVSEKQNQITEKDKAIEEQDKQLKAKQAEYKKQESEIDTLEGNLSVKQQEVTDMQAEKDKVQGNLNYIKKRLALTREEILKPSALDISSLDIKTREIQFKEFKNGKATFKATQYDDKEVEFKVKKDDNFADREIKAEYLRANGIAFDLDDSFNSWEKTISLVVWRVKYEARSTKDDENRKFNFQSSTYEFKISDYFDEKYLKEAFKVLVALWHLDDFPICLETGATDNSFIFCKGFKTSQDFSKKNKQSWDFFTATEEAKKKLEIWSNRFKTKEDFLGYWLDKTVEFVRTGKVDFFGLLNPFLLSKNYQS